MLFHTLIAITIICTRFKLCTFVSSMQTVNVLVPARSTLARILGLPAETEGFRATEGGRSPHFLLPLAVYAFEHSLLGLQGLGLGLSLGRDS